MYKCQTTEEKILLLYILYYIDRIELGTEQNYKELHNIFEIHLILTKK